MSQSVEQERKRLVEEQDREYNDLLKESKDEKELELAKVIALSMNEREDMELKADLEEIRQMELQTLHSISAVPLLVYPLAHSKKEDIYLLRFKLSDLHGKLSTVQYSFDRREPMFSVVGIIKFALQCKSNIQLLIPIRQKIHYNKNTSIEDSGIKNKSIIIVEQK